MSSPQYDLVVIGAGPGGYVAAIRGAHNGLRTALVEKDDRLGGTCTLRGCIPTKALLHSADVLEELRHAGDAGIRAENVGFDWAGVQKARAKVVTKSAAGVAYLMKNNKIDVYSGTGSLAGPGKVKVEAPAGKALGDSKNAGGAVELTTKAVVLATGSVVARLPFLAFDGDRFISSDDALELKAPPASMIILGAGAVGVELASIYQRFGTQCTLVEMLPRPLPLEDEEVSAELDKALRKRGIDMRLETKLEKAVVEGGKVVATLGGKAGGRVEADKLLVAVGRKPVTGGLGLEAAGVKLDGRGFVVVDEMMRTNVAGVYAVGDIVPSPALAHIATAEALVAVDHASGKQPAPVDYKSNPSCTYCDPEVASVGLSEAAAKTKGYTVKVGKFPFSAVGKARILNQLEGFVKVVADAQYDEILGVHIIGAHATDLIAEAALALRGECTVEELIHTIHAHPTLPEALLEAAHAAHGRPLHM